MTNVPDRIREMWKDVYVLFDKHFLMDCSNQDSWKAFWADASELVSKYQDVDSFIELIGVISELLYKFYAKRISDGNEKGQ